MNIAGMNIAGMNTVDQRAEILRRDAEPYVMVLVVRCESPTSAKPGARGVVDREGVITGWIGGGCAQPIVIEESRRALREGTPRLVRITPEAGQAEVNGLVTYEMVCHSGGTMDIFIEPVLPPPQLVILGRSPVARTLSRIAAALQYEVIVHAPLASAEDFPDAGRVEQTLDLSTVERPGQSFVVVSTQGEDDEGGMAAALRLNTPYLAFVASGKKWQAVSQFLEGQGFTKAQLARVKVPAGIEINAKDPEEIALSVMAQVVSERRSGAYPASAAREGQESDPGPAALQAIDPICNMTVEIATAQYSSDYHEQRVYFCGAGCKQKFDDNPAQYAIGGRAS